MFIISNKNQIKIKRPIPHNTHAQYTQPGKRVEHRIVFFNVSPPHSIKVPRPGEKAEDRVALFNVGPQHTVTRWGTRIEYRTAFFNVSSKHKV